MQTFQRQPKFHKFISGTIVGILMLTNVLAITPLASTTVALAQDSGVSFPTVKDLDWGKVYDDRTLRKENIDLDNMVELLENNTSSYVSELATKNQKLANWLKDNDNRSDFIKELQAYPGYDPDTPLTVMMLNGVTQAVIDSMIAQLCVTCSCNTVTGLHAYQVDLLDFVLENIQQSGRQFEVDGLEDRLTQILARSRNDCADLEMQRPQIAFANEVLVQHLAQKQRQDWREYTPGRWDKIDPIYSDFPELLEQSYQEYLREFGVDRAVIETILAQEQISQTIFAQTLGLEVSDLDLLDLEKATYSQLFNDTRNIGNVFTQPESKDLYRLLVKSKANLLYQTLVDNLREQVYQEQRATLLRERDSLSNLPGVQWQSYTATHISLLWPYGVSVGTVNNDNAKDLIFVSHQNTGAQIISLISDGKGNWNPVEHTFTETVSYQTWQIMDVDGNSLSDLVFVENDAGTGSLTLDIKLAQGDGQWRSKSTVYSEFKDFPPMNYDNYSYFFVGNINEDQLPDLIFLPSLGSQDRYDIITLLSTGNSGWKFQLQSLPELAHLIGVKDNLSSDSNQDGDIDYYFDLPLLGDVNHDGHTDVIYSNFISGSQTKLTTLLSGPDQSWQIKQQTIELEGLSSMMKSNLIGDANHDGYTDIFTVDQNPFEHRFKIRTTFPNANSDWRTIRNDYYAPINALGVIGEPSFHPILGDFNGDQQTDLIFANGPAGNNQLNLFVALSNGDGSWVPFLKDLTGNYVPMTSWPLVGNFDGDEQQRDDLLIVEQLHKEVKAELNLHLIVSQDIALTQVITEDTIIRQAQAAADWAVEDARAALQETAQKDAEISALAARTRIEKAFLPAARRHLITKILEQFKVKKDAFTNKVYDVQTLGDYLSVDLASDISIETSRTAFAVESLQTLVQSLLLGRESATDFKAPNFDNDRWRWTRSYGIWKAAMTVYLYPEDFLLPELRVPYWTPTFGELRENFPEISNLKEAQAALDFYLDEISDFDAPSIDTKISSVWSGNQIYFFFVGKTGQIYYSAIDEQTNWSYWRKIEQDPREQADISHIQQILSINDRIYVFYETKKHAAKALILGQDGRLIEQLDLSDLVNGTWNIRFVNEPVAFILLTDQTEYSLFTADLKQKLFGPFVTAIDSRFELLYTVSRNNYFTSVLWGTAEKNTDKYLLLSTWPGENDYYNIVGREVPAMPFFLPGLAIIKPINQLLPRVFGLFSVNYDEGQGSILVYQQPTRQSPDADLNSQWQVVLLKPSITTSTDSGRNEPVEIQGKPLSNAVMMNNKLYLLFGDQLVEFPWRNQEWQKAENWKPIAQLFLEVRDLNIELQKIFMPEERNKFQQEQYASFANFHASGMARQYLEELYFHLPLYLADKLNEAGKYEDADMIYRLIFNPFASDSSCNFLYKVTNACGIVVSPAQPGAGKQINALLNPHRTAQQDSTVYERYVVNKSVENLLDWADAEFVRDTRESVAHARELYEAAHEILPALPPEACQMQKDRPSINSDLFISEAAYGRNFCIPSSLATYSFRLRVDANLLKIRTGRNFAGIQRQILAQTTDVDPRLVAQSTTSDNADLDSLIPSEPPSVYRYSYLVERARQLTAQAQHLEAYLLSTLEKLDDENYALLQAKNDLKLKRGQVAVEDLRVKEAQQQTNLATIQQERAQFSQEHFNELIEKGVSKLENMAAIFNQLSIAAPSSVGTGGVSYSPQSSLQAMSQQFSTQASWERRQQEWQYQEDLAGWDVKIAEAGIAMAEVNEEISQKQRDLAALSSELSEETVDFLTEGQFTNAVLYRWMKKELRKLYRQQLNMATATARAAQRALAFELQEPLDFIAPQYWESQPTENREGLLAAEKLLFDLERLEQHRIERAERHQEITKVISLARMMPSEFQQFRQTGVLNFSTLMEWFDRDFPGGYMRMIKSVEMTVIALTPPGDSIHATLTNQGLSRIMVGSPWVEPKVIQRMPEMIALSSPIQASGLFELRLDDPMLLPFEGSGVETSWTFEMSPAANPLDFNTISDIWMTIRYIAKSDPDYRTKVIDRMESTFQGRVFYGMRESFADAWYQFHNPRFFADVSAYTDQSQPLPYSLAFTLDRTFFPPNEEQIKLTKVTLASQQGEPFTFTVPISVTFIPEGTQAKQRATGKLEDGVWSFGIFSGTVPTGAWTVAVNVSVCEGDTSQIQYKEFCSHAHKDTVTGQWMLDNTSWLENLLLILDYSAKLRYARP